MTRLFCLITFVLLVSGCQTTPTNAENQIACTESRPQICTRDYRPVCGIYYNQETKTYPNACNACSDHKVVAYTKKECSTE